MNKNFMGIDWSSRKGNKMFWLALLSSLIILARSIAEPLGFSIDFAGLEDNLAAIISAVFGVLVVLGVVMNPQSDGISDESTEEDTTKGE